MGSSLAAFLSGGNCSVRRGDGHKPIDQRMDRFLAEVRLPGSSAVTNGGDAWSSVQAAAYMAEGLTSGRLPAPRGWLVIPATCTGSLFCDSRGGDTTAGLAWHSMSDDLPELASMADLPVDVPAGPEPPPGHPGAGTCLRRSHRVHRHRHAQHRSRPVRRDLRPRPRRR
jgi:hypothetical protein